MLNNAHFYYKLLRKYVIIFGNFFDSITLIRYDAQDVEIQRIRVPLVYGPKDKYVSRTAGDPDLERAVQTTLPRMSFEITDIRYDPSRKQQSLHRIAASESAARVSSSFVGTPYDIDFELVVYAKNIDDGNHIVEQIVPYFPPDFTVTVNPIPELGFLKDIPIILNSVKSNIEYEGNYDSVRFVYWTLNFTLKGWFFGPISTPKIIRKAITNIFNDPSLVAGNIVRINTDTGNSGDFKLGDTIYQGTNYETATAYGFVNEWSRENQRLVIGGAQGQFTVNSEIRAVSTNAAYSISSFVTAPLKLVKITTVPDPIDAEPLDDYGYTETIEEYPNITE